MKNTIKDVAKAAGVSVSTVSRVLSGSPRISAQTTQRVKEVVKELDTSKLNEEVEKCREYNRRLAEKSQVYAGDEIENVQFDSSFGVDEEAYFSRMNIGESTVMGYVKIPKIGVYLSVYIRFAHSIAVYEIELADARSCQRFGCVSADAAHAEYSHP